MWLRRSVDLLDIFQYASGIKFKYILNHKDEYDDKCPAR